MALDPGGDKIATVPTVAAPLEEHNAAASQPANQPVEESATGGEGPHLPARLPEQPSQPSIQAEEQSPATQLPGAEAQLDSVETPRSAPDGAEAGQVCSHSPMRCHR